MITVALSKGRLFKDFIKFLSTKGLNHYASPLQENGRYLYKIIGDVKFIFAKGSDVPTYVEQGIADLGIVGQDIITEDFFDVLNVSKLPFGQCRLAIASSPNLNQHEFKVVATTFTNITRQYFNKQRQDVELIHLHGSVELAPILGLADAIVDIVQTGTTLKENNLVEYSTIMNIQARLIANKQSFYIKDEAIYRFIKEIGVI